MAMHSPTHDAQPFLTIITWPDGATRDDVAKLIADSTTLDTPSVRLRLGHAPPMILGQVSPDDARRAMNAMINAGGDAFAPTLAEMQRLGQTLKIKDLRVENGRIEVELWRGLSTTIRFDQIQILVRAHLHTMTTAPRHDFGQSEHSGIYASDVPMHNSFGLGGALGLAGAFASAYAGPLTTGTTKPFETTDKLDIHTTDGSVYQIDGDKFGFRALGELRGHSDKANMDAMCDLLAHLAPDKILDPYFPLWKPPTGYKRLCIPGANINQDDPAFAFYSRWAALLYRHILHG